MRRAFVFGSFSRGDFTAKSDIDFLVDFSAGTLLFDVIGLKHELEDLLGRSVDIVSRRAFRNICCHTSQKICSKFYEARFGGLFARYFRFNSAVSDI